MTGAVPVPVPTASTEVELFSVAGVDGFLEQVNTRFATLLGRGVGDLDGCSILELVHPSDIPGVVGCLAALDRGAAEVMLESRFRRLDGTFAHLQWVARPLPGDDSWWAAGRDMSAHHQARAAHADLLARFDLAVGHGFAVLWDLDIATGELTWEPGAASGAPEVAPSDLPTSTRSFEQAVPPCDHDELAAFWTRLAAAGRAEVELQIEADHHTRHVSLRGKVLARDRRGRAERAVGLLVDMTTQKALEEQVLRMVMTDALTGVPNRRAFDQSLRRLWRDRASSGLSLSVAIIDIDDFKRFNDTFGHLVGDEALTTVARALGAASGSSTEVTRFGGEEFAVVLPGVDAARALALGADLCAAVRSVQIRQAPDWELTISVGTATWSPGQTDLKAAQLLVRADDALYAAKAAGKDRALSYETALADRVLLEQAIAAGITAREFVLHYQPIVEVGSGRVAAFEALMRWERPGVGLVGPDQFIPVAEASDLICDLGRLALQMAARQVASWLDLGLQHAPGVCADFRVAVNLSGRHLSVPGVLDDVETALAAARLAADRLEVELTETAVVESARVAAHMSTLRSRGVRVSIDDFGTGNTSIGQLADLEVDTLKIDASFIADLGGRRKLVDLVVAAAHLFDLVVVAEGVEDPAVLTWLAELGCDLAQGYGLGRPLPAEQVVSSALEPTAG